MRKPIIKRGDIFFAEVPTTKGSEQYGVRPCIVLQNNIGNKYSSTLIVAIISGREKKINLPTHVSFSGFKTKLYPKSTIMLEQIKTIDCCRLRSYVEQADRNLMRAVDCALAISVGLGCKLI